MPPTDRNTRTTDQAFLGAGAAAGSRADSLTPVQIEFEQAVLAAAMMRGDVAERLPALCRSEDFFFASHRFIYAAICELVEQGEPADPLTVSQHLRQAGALDRAGGPPYFAKLADATPTAAHVDYYAQKVREAGEQRAIATFGSSLKSFAESGEADPLEVVAKAEEQLQELRRLTMRGQKALAPMTYEELIAADFPPPEYLIERVFPQGCILFHSVPKEGKTRLVSELAIAATTGGKFIGAFEVKQVGALCLFMEDSQPETQERFKGLTEAGPRPRDLHVAWEWETMDRGGLERLDLFLTEHPEVRLLIVDTLEYIRPPIQKDGQLYSQDVAALRKLKNLADKHRAFVVILHHSNKTKEHSDDVILSAGGTNGIAGSCDTIMQLQGKPDGTKVWRGKGRRIPPFAHVTKMDDRAGYQYLGEADTVNRSGEERDLLEVLAGSQWAMKESEIAQELCVKREAIRMRCHRAAKRKLVRRSGPAQWEITEEGRAVFLQGNDGNLTGVQPVRAVQPLRVVQGGSPVRAVRDEAGTPPEHDERGARPEHGGQPEHSEQPEHLSSSPQSAFVEEGLSSLEPPGHGGTGGRNGQAGHPSASLHSTPGFARVPDCLTLGERGDRERAWALAQEQGFPYEASVGQGEARWREWAEFPGPDPAASQIVRVWLEMRSQSR